MTLLELFTTRKQSVIENLEKKISLISNFLDHYDWRFLKGKVLAQAIIESLGNGCEEDSSCGYDARYWTDLISIKATQSCIFRRFKKRGKGFTEPQNIILANILGSGTTESVNFNYLIAVQLPTEDDPRLVVGLTDHANATKHKKKQGDQIVTKVYDWSDVIGIPMSPSKSSNDDIARFNQDAPKLILELLFKLNEENTCIPYTMKIA